MMKFILQSRSGHPLMHKTHIVKLCMYDSFPMLQSGDGDILVLFQACGNIFLKPPDHDVMWYIVNIFRGKSRS